MPLVDLPLEELRRYRPELIEPAGFADFWRDTLAEAARIPLEVGLTRVDTGLVTIETYDVTYAGFGGHPIKAWLHLPAVGVGGAERQSLPGVVQFIGYNGGRGLAHENTFWASAGFAHLVMDTRGQGSGWMVGDTADPGASGPAQPGFLTRGLDSPAEHYYRRVFVDAVRAVEVLRTQPGVASVSVAGVSQGGGIALAVAGLVDGLAAVMADVPFLCHFRRAAELAGDPYAEIVRYLAAHRDRVDQSFHTLAHVDAAVHARRADAPALFSVALMDDVCPPSTVFAAFHAYGEDSGGSAGSADRVDAVDKAIEVYPYNGHEGGQAHQQVRQLAWLRAVLEDR